jgi:predicted transcriptional regulator
MDPQLLLNLTADIVAAHLSHNRVATGDVANLVGQVHQALSGLSAEPAAPEAERREPAVSIRSSVKPDYLVCLVCGRKQKTLRRHLTTAHGLSPNEYRQEFGLKDDYPIVAPTYSENRRQMAHQIGLGRKRGGGDTPAGGGEAASGGTGRGRGGRKPAAASASGEAPRRGRPRKNKGEGQG